MRIITIITTFFVCIFYSCSGDSENNDTGLPPIEKISEFKFKFGGIILDQQSRSLEFNATSNQRNGLIEYALVHESGKTHESLFRTKVRPQILHACFLLLKHLLKLVFSKIYGPRILKN